MSDEKTYICGVCKAEWKGDEESDCPACSSLAPARCYAADSERIKALSAALQDCINLFNEADNAPNHKSLICTEDRREMWQEILRRHGAA